MIGTKPDGESEVHTNLKLLAYELYLSVFVRVFYADLAVRVPAFGFKLRSDWLHAPVPDSEWLTALGSTMLTGPSQVRSGQAFNFKFDSVTVLSEGAAPDLPIRVPCRAFRREANEVAVHRAG
jgi:hypothetical protein